MSDKPPPVGLNIWLAPTKPNHSVTNIRCWGKFWGQYKAKDKKARIFQCAASARSAAAALEPLPTAVDAPASRGCCACRRYIARVLVVYYGKESDWGDTWWTLSQNASLARCAALRPLPSLKSFRTSARGALSPKAVSTARAQLVLPAVPLDRRVLHGLGYRTLRCRRRGLLLQLHPHLHDRRFHPDEQPLLGSQLEAPALH